jgi:ribA/ribD-fused uncharacterized protein
MSRIIVSNIDWLRNDYPVDIKVGDITYATLEHAYQASKFLDEETKVDISRASVKEAKKIGRSGSIRSDWKDVRENIMKTLLGVKFAPGSLLADRLAKTGSAEIVLEGYSNFWGTKNDGSNILGEILEILREELQDFYGIDPDDYNDAPEKITLAEALEDCDLDLIDLVDKLYTYTKDMINSTIDANDMDPEFISRKTGVSVEDAKKAVSKLQIVVNSLNNITAYLDDCDSGSSVNLE